MARSTMLAFGMALALALPASASARKYDRAIQAQQDRYDHWRGVMRHTHGQTRHHAVARMHRALRGKRHWQRVQAQHFAPRWVLPRFVVMCESAGNSRAVNTSNPSRPAGLYQMITATWLGYGGGAFAPTADRATVREQGVVALRVLAGQGQRAWECWT